LDGAETPDGDVYIGQRLNGDRLEIPAAALTNVFAWWRVTTDKLGCQTEKKYYLTDRAMSKWVENDSSALKRNKETGEIENAEWKSKLPPDVKPGRVVRS
jgi:hypothetical protein